MDARQRRNASFVLVVFPKLSEEIKKNADKRADFRRCRNGTFVLVGLPKVSGEIKNADKRADFRRTRKSSPQFTKRK